MPRNKYTGPYKGGKFWIIGKEGQEIAQQLKINKTSYREIMRILNEKYKDLLNNHPFTSSDIYQYFVKWGNKDITEKKQIEREALLSQCNSGKELNKMMKMLDEWMEQYYNEGAKLPLKDVFNIKLRALELLDKINQETKTEGQTVAVQAFLAKVQNEFSTPTVTKEVEYDKDGNITKAKITQKTTLQNTEEIKETEKVETEGEVISEEVKSSSNSSSSQTENQ